MLDRGTLELSKTGVFFSLGAVLLGVVLVGASLLSATQLRSASAICREAGFPPAFDPRVPEAVRVSGEFILLPFGARCTWVDPLATGSSGVVVEPGWIPTITLFAGLILVLVGVVLAVRRSVIERG